MGEILEGVNIIIPIKTYLMKMSFEVFLSANGSRVEAVTNHQFVVEYLICQSSNRVDRKTSKTLKKRT